jgi:uncharacterized protein YciI
MLHMKKYLLILLVAVGSLPAFGQPFIFVFLNSNPNKAELPKAEVDQIMEGHMANIQRLAKEKKLIAAGPFETGGGIFVFNSGSKEEVGAWLETDPGIRARRWNIEIFDYKPRTGSICAVGETYEMTNYQFVRFGINVTKYTMADMAAELKSHEQYLKQLARQADIIQDGTFGAAEGGIIVVRGELSRELIEQDPAVQKGFMEFEIKKLFVAKGSFCEK